jgi:AcrR family transcriptional regulator
MRSKKGDNRTRLIQAAVKMTYRHGFANTSLADVAKEAKVPLGNVYYYFKTKTEIGEAIVEHRLSQYLARRSTWDEATSPNERLCAFVDDVLANRDMLAQGGCPVGTFCSELHKLQKDGGLATKAKTLFAQHLEWIETQFRSLKKGKEARPLAVHLLSALQGVAVLAHSLGDPSLVETETERLKQWIHGL